MTQEKKELLLKDLCGRLPYGVKMGVPSTITPIVLDEFVLNVVRRRNDDDFKPYLRPMSSMTEEEFFNYKQLDLLDYSNDGFEMPNFRSIDWLNSRHFDFRGLIEKGLALEASEDMYKEK